MNLFFRLLLVFFRARFAKQQLGIFDEAVLKSRVLLTDQDMFAHMTNSRYFSFSDLAIINYIVRIGCWPILRKKGWFPVVCGEDVILTRMLRTPQKFEIRSRLAGWTEDYICFHHRFVRDDKQTAEVHIVARFASRKLEKVTIPNVVDAVGYDGESPQLSEHFLTMIRNIERARETSRDLPQT